MMDAHFPGIAFVYPRDVGACPGGRIAADWPTARRLTSPDRVTWAIGSFELYKSPGVDGIYPVLLQKGLGLLLEPLTKIFRACLAIGFVPGAWKTAKVVFIPKVGRVGHSTPKDYS